MTEKASSQRVLKDVPGYRRDPVTGKFRAVPFTREEFTAICDSLKGSPSPETNSHNHKYGKNYAGARKELFTKPSKPVPAKPYLQPKKPAKKPLKKSVIPSIVVSKCGNTSLAQPLPPTPMLNFNQELKHNNILATKTTETSDNLKNQEIILKKIDLLIKMQEDNAKKFETFQQIQEKQQADINKILTIIVNAPKIEEQSKKIPLNLINDDMIENVDQNSQHTPLKNKLSSHHPTLYRTKYSASKKPSEKISIIEEESPTLLPSQTEPTFKTPDSHHDTVEFEQMEQLFMTPKNALQTPISSVCNLFKTMDVEEENAKPQKNPLKRHSPLFKSMDVDDEYVSPKRRSLRLEERIIDTNQVSPVVIKPDDLRKRILTRSLVKNYQNSPKSPRTKKALDMYVSTKNDYNYLLTPSFSKKRQLAPGDNSIRKRFSQKVQQQCLLLQDSD